MCLDPTFTSVAAVRPAAQIDGGSFRKRESDFPIARRQQPLTANGRDVTVKLRQFPGGASHVPPLPKSQLSRQEGAIVCGIYSFSA